MSLEQVVNQLSLFITEELNLGEGVEITYHTSLNDIGIDSIAMMQLLVVVEEHFQFEFDEDLLLQGSILCISDLVDCIMAKSQIKVS
ncbi:acyl carrier protein [Pelosinus fermentans]|uniref:Acyl carrier protein familyprotein n=1 Tax=Pelosinus fermentans JBW45 TaxID=1192197 RepID=I8TUY4_9FIRM|nr:acyl carrier protein [Pelosinus fermentans]AJQ26611.1 acyl carrier protein familyprotein [Pelosinus fermentans JBW45]